MEKFEIVRSRRKTLSLTVKGDGTVLVRAPLTASDRAVNEFVQSHLDWIQERKLHLPEKLDLSDGATISLFGADYLIRSGRGSIRKDAVYLPAGRREEVLKRLLRQFALEVMQALTERIAKSAGFSFSRVRVSSARGRWGSCNREGVIAYSFRVAFLPPRLCEYVAVHELAHTLHFDHSPAFWNCVAAVLPDWKIRRRELKENRSMSYL